MAAVANYFVRLVTVRIPGVGKRVYLATKPNVLTFWRFAKVELKPPTISEIPQVSESVSKLTTAFTTQAWKKTTVKEAWLNTLICMEVVFCFFIGEVIGKRTLVGYGRIHKTWPIDLKVLS